MEAYTTKEIVQELFRRYDEVIIIGYLEPQQEIDVNTKLPNKVVQMGSALRKILIKITKQLQHIHKTRS